jgi:predicted tellurium resistance membrane protein TerC
MVDHIAIMMIAVVLAVIVMMIFADRVSHFIERHPTIKMLALAFMLLIGVLLVAEGLGRHIERGYVYFAMAFSLFVEILNMRSSRRFSEVSHRAETPE